MKVILDKQESEDFCHHATRRSSHAVPYPERSTVNSCLNSPLAILNQCNSSVSFVFHCMQAVGLGFMQSQTTAHTFLLVCSSSFYSSVANEDAFGGPCVLRAATAQCFQKPVAVLGAYRAACWAE